MPTSKKPVAKKEETSAKKKATSKKPVAIKKEIAPKKEEIKVNENILSDNIEIEELWGKSSSKNIKSIIIVLVVLLIAIILAFFIYNQKPKDLCSLPDSKIDSSKEVKAWSKIKVDYIWRLADWTIFDSSIEECSKRTKNYKADSWRKFEPLAFEVWAGQMIKWFDAGVVGMKLWESKTIKISPADAYWDKFSVQKIKSRYLHDKFLEEVPKESFQDVITKEFPKAAFENKEYKVWEIIEAGWMKWKVEAISESWITLSIENTQNPFYWKKIIKWLTWEFQWQWIEIKEITKTWYTVEINNNMSPFKWKELKPWLSWKLPNGQEIRIKSIDWEDAEIEIPNTHELAWKTLIFEVQVKQID